MNFMLNIVCYVVRSVVEVLEVSILMVVYIRMSYYKDTVISCSYCGAPLEMDDVSTSQSMQKSSDWKQPKVFDM